MTMIDKIIKARELPPEWSKEFADQNAAVRVQISEVDAELEAARAKGIDAVMDLISLRAQARGLTPELLREILDER
jgi:hypothetical protein